MKIIAISDTHGEMFVNNIPECDILLHCGDISPVKDHSLIYQREWLFNSFIPKLSLIPAKNIVFIAGNHDYFLYHSSVNRKNHIIKEKLPKNVHYLCDESVDINGITIHGTPWSVLPTWARKGFPVWNFAERDNVLANTYVNIPLDLDILITHGPAYGFSDTIMEYNKLENLGSKSLTAALLKAKPKYVFSGHIHSANHNIQHLYHDAQDQATKLACVSLLDEGYQMNYPVFELDFIK